MQKKKMRPKEKRPLDILVRRQYFRIFITGRIIYDV
jgi:hypothetical protein